MTEISFLHGVVGSGEPERLPRGQHDLSSEFVAGHQRSRILEATTFVLYEHGYVEATVAQIVRRARVSRRTFYENFENKEHCCLATFGSVVECMACSIRQSHTGDEWAARTAAAFADLGRLLIENPEASYTVLVEMGAAGREADDRRSAALAQCRAGLRALVEDRAPDRAVSPVALELAVSGLVGVLGDRLRAHDPEGAAHVLPDAVGRVLAGLVSDEDAREVTARLRVLLPASAAGARETTA